MPLIELHDSRIGEMYNRLGTLEDMYVVATWFQVTNSQSGSITLPNEAKVILDSWPEGVDALVCGIDSFGRPNYEAVYTSGSVEITASLALDPGTGDYTDYALSGTPTGGFPCVVLYAYRVPLKYLDAEKILIEEGIQSTTGGGMPAGGTTGQVLAKLTDADYDTAWINQSGGTGSSVAALAAAWFYH